ncbi:MAG: hypothetical protein ACYDCC_03550 [Actinomycetota bacterium]
MKQIIDQADELAKRFERFEPEPGDRSRAKSLGALHRATVARADAEAKLAKAVEKARADGHSWAVIGELLGTSGEAARQRYDNKHAKKRKAV